jgi:hypothetical protein
VQVLYLPPGTLQPGANYTASVTVSHADAPTERATASVAIHVGHSAPVAIVDGFSRAAPANASLSLSGMGSYDPDETADANAAGAPSLSYNWT